MRLINIEQNLSIDAKEKKRKIDDFFQKSPVHRLLLRNLKKRTRTMKFSVIQR